MYIGKIKPGVKQIKVFGTVFQNFIQKLKIKINIYIYIKHMLYNILCVLYYIVCIYSYSVYGEREEER